MYTTRAQIAERIRPKLLATLASDSDVGIRSDADAVTALGTAAVQANIDRAIEDASAFMNGFVVGYVTVTDAEGSVLLEKICSDITIYYLYDRNGYSRSTNPYMARYDSAVRQLQSIQSGDTHISETPELPAANSRRAERSDRIFSSTNLDGFRRP